MATREHTGPGPAAVSPLSRLEALLGEQLALAARGETDKAAELLAAADGLLAAAAAAPADAGGEEALRRVARLHQRLRLALATQRGELAERLSRISTGKASLRAYRSSSGP